MRSRGLRFERGDARRDRIHADERHHRDEHGAGYGARGDLALEDDGLLPAHERDDGNDDDDKRRTLDAAARRSRPCAHEHQKVVEHERGILPRRKIAAGEPTGTRHRAHEHGVAERDAAPLGKIDPEPAAEEQDGRDGQNDLAVRAQMLRTLAQRDDLVDDDVSEPAEDGQKRRTE